MKFPIKKSISKFNSNNLMYHICKDQIWVPSPKRWMDLGQKVQNNEFVESELENQDLVNQTTSKVDLNDKRMKIDKFKLKKIVLGTVRGDQFLYIDSQI